MARPRRLTIARLMGLVALVAIVLALPELMEPGCGEPARWAQCVNNLKQIGVALHQYHQVYGAFPAGTVANPRLPPERRLSWHSVILESIEGYPLVMDWSKGWANVANRVPVLVGAFDPTTGKVGNPSRTHPPGLTCPSNLGPPSTGLGLTPYVGIAGLGRDAPRLPAGDRRAGLFGYDRRTGVAEITDGTSTTMAVIDTATANGPWSAGGAATVRGLDPSRQPYLGEGGQFAGIHRRGTNVLFADGSVRSLKSSIAPRVFEAISTIAGGEWVAGDSLD